MSNMASSSNSEQSTIKESIGLAAATELRILFDNMDDPVQSNESSDNEMVNLFDSLVVNFPELAAISIPESYATRSSENVEALDLTKRGLFLTHSNAHISTRTNAIDPLVNVSVRPSLRPWLPLMTDTQSQSQVETRTMTTGHCQVQPEIERHIFISDNSASSLVCKKIGDELKNLGYKVWIDRDNLSGNVLESISQAIENAYIVLLCCDRKYNESSYCRSEVMYAVERGTKFITCLMETSFLADDWLDMTMGDHPYVDFSSPNDFDRSFKRLIDEITHIEAKLAIHHVAITSPTDNNSSMLEHFDAFVHNFKESINKRDHGLEMLTKEELCQMIHSIRSVLSEEEKSSTFDNSKKPYPNMSSSVQHVQVNQCQKSVISLVIQTAPICCNELIGFTLMINDQCPNDQNICESIRALALKRNISIFIVGLDLDSSFVTMATDGCHEIQTFEDECACISHILSTENRLIYFAVSALVGELVVPLIQDHMCVERIYIYNHSDSDQKLNWTENYSKIRGVWSSIAKMEEQVTRDIGKIMKRPSRWSRSPDLFVKLWRQKLETTSLDTTLDTNGMTSQGFDALNIVILFCSDRRLFHLSHNSLKIDEFTNVDSCADFIQTNEKTSSIFLIICTNASDSCNDIRFLMDFVSVHAVYIFVASGTHQQPQTVPIYDSPKLSGVFDQYDDLLHQLARDMCFYRQIPSHIPKMSVLKASSNIITQLDRQQMEFVRFQLFIDILQQLPFISDESSDLFACINTKNASPLSSLVMDTMRLGQITNDLFKQSDLLVLLRASPSLRQINRDLGSLAANPILSSITTYRAQLLSDEDLQMIRQNINSFLAIHTFILSSRSLPTVTSICRQASDNGLVVVLFEIVMPEKSSLIYLDSDTVAFRLGSVFRILAVNQAPDSIWHIQLDSTDCSMSRIKEQLQFEIGERHSWLTFGNYLATLKQFDAAKIYYEYLLDNISIDDPIRASIYHNIGLIYSAMNDEEAALKFFEIALSLFVNDVSLSNEHQNSSHTLEQLSGQDSDFNRAMLYGKIAEDYYREKDYTKALDYYRKALTVATDLTPSLFYQGKIEKTLKILLTL